MLRYCQKPHYRERSCFCRYTCRTAIWAVMFFAWTIAAHATTLTVQWDPSPDPRVTGYLLSWGTQSGVYTNTIDVGTHLTTTL